MTRNTLTYLQLKETQRSNLVRESQNARDLKRKESELAETMRNNMRNYGINVQKNQIQKLANDQLNTREANKLLATIQDNLAQQQLKLQQNIETARNNQEKNRLEQELNDIKRMDTLLNAAKATGKTPDAILLSWFLNQANLQAFTGQNTVGNLTQQFSDWLSNGSDSLTDSTGAVRPVKGAVNKLGYDPVSRTRRHLAQGNDLDAYRNAYLTDAAYTKKSRRRDLSMGYNDENEIPEDFSNSYGPGGKPNETITGKTQKAGEDGNQNTRISGGPGENLSQSGNSNSGGKASVIYSPGSKRNSESGPGVGVAFS